MNPAPALAIHGGAGTILRSSILPEQESAYRAALSRILQAGQKILLDGGSSIDAVTLAVSLLEDCDLFNAGKGSVYTHSGTHEMDAAIMDGRDLSAGAVACVSRIKNPVHAARLVMERSPHVLLVAEGAEAFARAHQLEFADPAYFHTDARYAQWQKALAQNQSLLDHDAASLVSQTNSGDPIDPEHKFGTVGAVALDRHGNLAAATSTGGMTNKLAGRVGDSPMLGAGCYADNQTAALSATGTGEAFMRSLALHDIAAQMRYAQRSLEEAARITVMQTLPRLQGSGGIIAIDRCGNIAMPFNSEGMYRGAIRGEHAARVAIYANE